MKISDILIASLVFMALIFGFTSFYGSMGSAYKGVQPNLTTSDISSNFDASGQINNYLWDIGNKSVSIGEKFSGLNIVGGLFDTGALFLDVISILAKIPQVLIGFVGAAQSSIGLDFIPAWFSAMILGIIGTIFIFKILSIWLKREV